MVIPLQQMLHPQADVVAQHGPAAGSSCSWSLQRGVHSGAGARAQDQGLGLLRRGRGQEILACDAPRHQQAVCGILVAEQAIAKSQCFCLRAAGARHHAQIGTVTAPVDAVRLPVQAARGGGGLDGRLRAWHQLDIGGLVQQSQHQGHGGFYFAPGHAGVSVGIYRHQQVKILDRYRQRQAVVPLRGRAWRHGRPRFVDLLHIEVRIAALVRQRRTGTDQGRKT